PVAIQEHNSGIGWLYPEDKYNCYVVYCTVQEWEKILYQGPFQYVYLFHVDGYFSTGYCSLFEDEAYLVNGSLLEVVRHDNGTVTLRGIVLGKNT
ncbi:MAG: hypothetical protein IJ347_02220, partial [Faecalibacterium sp.]|nr:hypothetical protein [Faecalibacterium sp.]